MGRMSGACAEDAAFGRSGLNSSETLNQGNVIITNDGRWCPDSAWPGTRVRAFSSTFIWPGQILP